MARKLATLFSYNKATYATRTLRALRAAWPDITFTLVQSPYTTYGFRSLILATRKDGTRGYVERRNLAFLKISLALS
jgi:hypothetical protein